MSIEVNKKIFTFTSLNTLKLVFRTFSVCEPASFLLSASPYIFLKLIHYLNHRRGVSFNELQFFNLVYPIYASFAILVSLVDINYLPITLIYLVNHKKREWLKIKKWLALNISLILGRHGVFATGHYFMGLLISLHLSSSFSIIIL